MACGHMKNGQRRQYPISGIDAFFIWKKLLTGCAVKFMEKTFKAKITLFHCINAFTEKAPLSTDRADVKIIKMPCSGMVTEVFLLKAFEAGADAVSIFVCPEGACRYTEGNIRAGKRMEKTRAVLDEIGVKGSRLTMHQVKASDGSSAGDIISGILKDLEELGPNPAA